MNYDILSLLIKSMEILMKQFTEANYYKILQVIDTITEFIQGPCVPNQVALAESRFIELVGTILEVFIFLPKNFLYLNDILLFDNIYKY